jgi:hypothetical protein
MDYSTASCGVSTAVIPEACLPAGRSVDRESRNHAAFYIFLDTRWSLPSNFVIGGWYDKH